MLYTFKINGMATMSFNFKPDRKNKTSKYFMFVYSKIGILYNIFLLCLIMALNYHGMWTVFKDSYGRVSQFARIMDIVVTEYIAITSSLVLVVYCVRQDRAIAIATNIEKIRKLSIILNRQTNQNEKSLCIIKIFVSNFIFWLLTISMTPIHPANVLESVCFYSIVYLCDAIYIALLTQYNVILLLIKELFKTINYTLHDISKECTWTRQIGFTRSSTVRINLDKLQYSRKLYSSISKITQDVSDFYSFSMFWNVLQIFLSTTLYLYYVGEPIFLGSHVLPIIFYLYLCFSVCLIFVPFVNLTKCVSSTVMEVIT